MKVDCKPKALEMQTSVPPGLFAAGNILKTALTNPTEVSDRSPWGQRPLGDRHDPGHDPGH